LRTSRRSRGRRSQKHPHKLNICISIPHAPKSETDLSASATELELCPVEVAVGAFRWAFSAIMVRVIGALFGRRQWRVRAGSAKRSGRHRPQNREERQKPSHCLCLSSKDVASGIAS
jgi:hypothetical protein